MKRFVLYLFIPVILFALVAQAEAVSFSVDREASGTEDSALEDAPGTGTVPNTVFNSDLLGSNTVGASGDNTGTSGYVLDWGQNVDAIHFGPGVDPELIGSYYFSLDYGAGYFDIEPYPSGSGTEAAQGTGTAPSNVYSSTANGTNEYPYPFSGPDMGIEPYSGSNLDAFDLQNFISPDSYPLYFSLDLCWQQDYDFDGDGNTDVTAGGADILVTTGNGGFEVAIPAEELGLEEDANIDALTMLSDESWLFSVDHGRWYDPWYDEWYNLGPQGLEDTAVYEDGEGRRPANIYRSFEGYGNNDLWLSSEALGLPSGWEVYDAYADEFGWEYAEYLWEEGFFFGPNLDALDIAPIPEPSSLALLGLGLLGLFRKRKKS